jgi:CheY-like chemotaxis protein
VNLLIVDDHATNRKLLRAQLEAKGHAVFEAHDGVEALALLERQRVDAVISDILMPRMDGYRLCYEIRAHARLESRPGTIAPNTRLASPRRSAASGSETCCERPTSWVRSQLGRSSYPARAPIEGAITSTDSRIPEGSTAFCRSGVPMGSHS